MVAVCNSRGAKIRVLGLNPAEVFPRPANIQTTDKQLVEKYGNEFFTVKSAKLTREKTDFQF
jgi:hypothetical protein